VALETDAMSIGLTPTRYLNGGLKADLQWCCEATVAFFETAMYVNGLQLRSLRAQYGGSLRP